MKLFSLLIVLLLWKVATLRQVGAKITMVESYLQLLDTLFKRFPFYVSQAGFLLTLFLGPILLAFVDTILGPTIFRLAFEIIFLFVVLSHLLTLEFHFTRPPVLPENIDESLKKQLPDSLWRLNDQWVTPLFCYLMAGVFGLSVYWIVASMQQNSATKWKEAAHTWLEVLGWVPARILALAYAIAGNFSKGIKVLSEYLAAGILFNDFIVQRTAVASIDPEKDISAQCTKLQRDAHVILLGMYALLAILSWMI